METTATAGTATASTATASTGPSIGPVADERRHTLHFLREIRSFSPVFLDTEVDMTHVMAHRAAARESGQSYSLITYLLYVSARVLAAHPEANAAIQGRWRPRIAHHGEASAKVTFDKTLGGRRIVLSTVLPSVDSATLLDIQKRLEHFRDGDPETMPEFRPTRMLHKLPVPVGRLLFRVAARPLKRRAELWGTYAVTSLGHRSVDSFHSMGGTTITLGVGRATDRPVVRAGELAIAPVLRLSLAFDHRVIDGAEAADVLTEIKQGLESFPDGPGAVA